MKFIAAGAVLQGCTALALCGSAAAQTTGDAASGHALASRWCSICHEVEAKSKHAKGAPPTFVEIAAAPGATERALKGYLMRPHANMPDFRLSNDELDDLAAYIRSLKTE